MQKRLPFAFLHIFDLWGSGGITNIRAAGGAQFTWLNGPKAACSRNGLRSCGWRAHPKQHWKVCWRMRSKELSHFKQKSESWSRRNKHSNVSYSKVFVRAHIHQVISLSGLQRSASMYISQWKWLGIISAVEYIISEWKSKRIDGTRWGPLTAWLLVWCSVLRLPSNPDLRKCKPQQKLNWRSWSRCGHWIISVILLIKSREIKKGLRGFLTLRFVLVMIFWPLFFGYMFLGLVLVYSYWELERLWQSSFDSASAAHDALCTQYQCQYCRNMKHALANCFCLAECLECTAFQVQEKEEEVRALRQSVLRSCSQSQLRVKMTSSWLLQDL